MPIENNRECINFYHGRWRLESIIEYEWAYSSLATNFYYRHAIMRSQCEQCSDKYRMKDTAARNTISTEARYSVMAMEAMTSKWWCTQCYRTMSRAASYSPRRAWLFSFQWVSGISIMRRRRNCRRLAFRLRYIHQVKFHSSSAGQFASSPCSYLSHFGRPMIFSRCSLYSWNIMPLPRHSGSSEPLACPVIAW